MANRLPQQLQARITANVVRILARKRWKPEHIHRNSDVDKGNLSRYFNGHRDYTLLSVIRIADVLQVDVVELFKPLRQSAVRGRGKAGPQERYKR